MTNTPTAPLDADVTHLEFLTFCEEAFRNMRAPIYSSGEMSDVRRALATFARHRLASTQGSQGREAEAISTASVETRLAALEARTTYTPEEYDNLFPERDQ